MTTSVNAPPRALWRPLLIINLAAACYSLGTVWLAQLNWQLWRYVGPAEFDAYHRAWWHGIWWAIFPAAGVAFLGVCAQLRWRPPRVPPWTLWLALGLQLLAYAGTALWWGPGQGGLHQALLAGGGIDPHYQDLVISNWLRVGLLTAAAALQIWMTTRSLTTPHVGSNVDAPDPAVPDGWQAAL